MEERCEVTSRHPTSFQLPPSPTTAAHLFAAAAFRCVACYHRSKNNTCDQRSWSCWMSLSKLRLGMGCKKWRTAEHHYYYYPGIIALSINGRWLWSKRTLLFSSGKKVRPTLLHRTNVQDCFSRSSFWEKTCIKQLLNAHIVFRGLKYLKKSY